MECEYCGEELEETKGKLFVTASGEKFYFCSGKCEKNWKSNRNLEYSED